MKKLQNMERLWQKMQARFGDQDALVLEFKQELLALREKNRKNQIAKNFGRRQADPGEAPQAMH